MDTRPLTSHPFFRTQMVYDHAPEAASIAPYTRALWDRQHRMISADIARFKPVDRVRMLDVGCGPAHISESQNHHIALYVGVEPSRTELARAKRLPGRHFVNGAAEEMDFLPANSFDVAIMVSMLDHCVDWKQALAHTVRALRPGGLILIAMENADQIPSRVRHALGRKVEHHDHMHFISLADVEAALGHGFTPLKARTFGYGFGLHSITEKLRLPRQIFDAVIPIMDAMGRATMPRAGQVLYGLYRKAADPSAVINDTQFADLDCERLHYSTSA